MARELVRDVEVPEDLLKLLAETVVKLGIRTSRAEIVTIRTAKALAALNGRARVAMEDLQKAMELALPPHRLKARPFERPRMPIPPPQPMLNEGNSQGGRQMPSSMHNQQGGAVRGGEGNEQGGLNGGSSVGDEANAYGDTRRYGVSSVDIPVEFRRELIRTGGDRGLKSRSSFRRVVGQPHGIPYMYLPPRNGGDLRDIDLTASIVHASLRGGSGLPIRVSLGDLMVRVRRSRTPPRVSLIILDASGSMNFMRRIEVAKGGLVRRITEESYVRRSYVGGLISFRGGRGVDVVIEPTRNYWQVLNALDELPSGGGATPMPAALAYAVDLIKRLNLKLKGDYWVYLITDGKANVPLTGDVREEVERFMGELSRLARVVVYDTRPRLLYDPSISHMDILSRYAIDVVRVGE